MLSATFSFHQFQFHAAGIQIANSFFSFLLFLYASIYIYSHNLRFSFSLSDSLALELVAATGTDATSHPLAKCYSSLKLSVDTSCTLTITSNNGNNFVQSLWSDRVTYSSVMACPTLYSQVFADAPADSDVGTLLAGAIWANTPVTAPTVVSATGSLTITSSGATLKFRPITRTGSGTVSYSRNHTNSL